MSADNGIYVLITRDNHKRLDKFTSLNTFGEGVIAYRVAYASAIDNLEWYLQNEPHNFGYCLNEIFGESEVFYEYGAAMLKAVGMSSDVGYIEYGIVTLDYQKYNFPGY